MKKHSKTLFVFRRDLRLEDNMGLLQALEASKKIVPCFIFDPRQVSEKNSYKSHNALQFMLESLSDLEQQLKKKNARLYFFYGPAEKVLESLLKKDSIDAVYCNRDYTPFSAKRDKKIKTVCDRHAVACEITADALCCQPEDILTLSGTPYAVFSAFYKNAYKKTIPEPKKMRANKADFYTGEITGQKKSAPIFEKIMPKKQISQELHTEGGRKNGRALLKKLSHQKGYAQMHNYPIKETSSLSAHHKFGTISIRESYHAIKKTLGAHHPLLRQLYWRDFFTHVAYHHPSVFGQPYHKKYAQLPWENNKKKFNAWCSGNTGFPIVDAGMRQLNTTGFMHNRVRMIVASFLTKDLHIDWRWGEKYFAQNLIDYDPAVNNGNWQWAASTGCDAQPYFRIFNPWLQQKKFDPQCEYIKKWLPELKTVPAQQLHKYFDVKQQTAEILKEYPKPIVDHATESRKAKILYKNSSA